VLAGCSQSGTKAASADLPPAVQDANTTVDAGPDLAAADIAELPFADAAPPDAAVAQTDAAETDAELADADAPAVQDVAEDLVVPADVADLSLAEVELDAEVVDANPVSDVQQPGDDVPEADVPDTQPADEETVGDTCVNAIGCPCTQANEVTDCSDANDCTSDACELSGKGVWGCVHTALSGAACTDGDNCTVGDQCALATCVTGAVKVCQDNNPCTDDVCDGATGNCAFAANTKACDDGDACTQVDVCQAAACVGSDAVVCGAGDACHDAGTCNAATGACTSPLKADATACDDGNSCTKEDTCKAGVCEGNPYSCAAPAVCHEPGVCQGDGTCTFAAKPDATICEDGDACTKADLCAGGVCGGTSYSCATPPDSCHTAGVCKGDGTCLYPSLADATLCDDGNGCTRTDSCLGGTCTGGNPVFCSATNACHLTGACNPATGICSDPKKDDGTPCDDGSLCTGSDGCQNGACQGGGALPCDDDNPCTTDGCLASSGCTHVALADGVTCTDGSVCTTGDSCQVGLCTGVTVDCADSDPCTADACDKVSGCSHPAGNDGAACDDQTVCTQNDTCTGGTCAGESYTCTAATACHLAGVCVGDGSCSFALAADSTPCTDGDACTWGETCKAGSCEGGQPYVCDVQDPQCQATASCDGAGGCVIGVKEDGTNCDDGEPCTVTDTCASGACVGSGTPACDDANVCTDDSCAPGVGCQHSAVSNGEVCSDDNACTKVDSCQAGVCTGAEPVVCAALDPCHVIGLCDTSSGLCSDPPQVDGTVCDDDQACTKSDVCTAGICGGTAYTCDAADACHEAGICAGNGSCTFAGKPNGTPCDDQVACTKSDTCNGAVCSGTPYTCSEPGECQTSVSCDGTGCAISAKADDTACSDDGTACTTDACQGGACSHKQLDCNDDNACTLDTCYYALGCLHNFDAAQQAYLKSPSTKEMGYSVAVAGDTAVVGAPGTEKVVVFVRSGAMWTQQQVLTASNSASGDRFGQAVALSGNTIVVGAPNEDSNSATTPSNDNAYDSGAVYVYVRSGVVWTQQQYLKASNISAGDHFGTAVGISGEYAIVGSPSEAALAYGINPAGDNESYPGSGAAYTFARSGAKWTQEARIKPSNDYYYWTFGSAVAISDGTAVVGAPGEGSTGSGVGGVKNGPYTASSSGAAWVYLRSGSGAWLNQGNMKAPVNHAGDKFGTAVSISGDTIVIGAPPANKVFTYLRGGSTWTAQATLAPTAADAGDAFGSAVAVSGGLIAVGSPYEDGGSIGVDGLQTDNSLLASGAVYLFGYGGSWTAKAYLKTSNPDGGNTLNPNNGDRFGWSVAVADATATVIGGAIMEDSKATTVDGDQTDNSLTNVGAAYVFLTAPYATCEDGNLCTDDARSGAVCACQYDNNLRACSNTDDNTCTDDFCGGGTCSTHKANDASTCTDGNPCTDDGCVAGVCSTLSKNQGPCSDNNACTVGDTCDGSGTCKPGGDALKCGGCATCDPVAGCVDDPCCVDPFCCGDFCCQNPSDCSCDPCCYDPCGPICNGC